LDRLNGVIAFVRAAELKSFAAAGRQLGLSPSAVGKAVARLEERLGARLMTRTTRAISLTEEGELFLERAREALDGLSEAERAVQGAHAAPRGLLRVDLPAAFGRLVVLPSLGPFRDAYPGIELEIRLGDRLVDLVAEGVDAVVRIGPIADSGLVARRLGFQREVIVASPAYLVARSVPEHPEALDGHDLILFRYPTSNRPHAWRFRDSEQRYERPVTARVSVNDGEGLAAVAAAGFGLAQVPVYMARPLIEAGKLATVLDAFRDEGPPVHLLFAPGRQRTAKVRAFADHLVEVAGPALA